MQVRNDIVMGLIQADLHERFGPGWSVEVLEHPNPGKAAPGTVVRARMRCGSLGEEGSVAVNANMLAPHLRLMVEVKSIQEQVHEAIGGEWNPPYYLNERGLNTCKDIHERVMNNLDRFAWTEQNNPE